MKTHTRIIVFSTPVAIILLVSALLAHARRTAEVGESSATSDADSMSTAIDTLAAERYALSARHGTPPILTLHYWSNNDRIIKYRDKHLTLISLPAFEEDWMGMCKFVESYNVYHVRASDLLVKSGKYKDAERVYRLLLRFDRRKALKNEVEARLEALTRLESGTAAWEQVSRTFTEYEGLFTMPDMTKIESTRAVVVTNLLSVTIP